MTTLPLVNKSLASPETQDLLSTVEKKYGFVPNLISVLANSTATLQAYMTLSELMGKTSFTPEEQQIVLLSVSFENSCAYCMAAHSMVASKMVGMSNEKLETLRDGKNLGDKKLNELARFTRKLVNGRGYVDQNSIKSFLDVGYTQQHILEVILGVAMKTLSNYTNHIAETPVDAAFSEFRWTQR